MWGLAWVLTLGLELEGAIRLPFGRGQADELVFEAVRLEQRGVAAQFEIPFEFVFTNAAAGPVTIESVRTSCGCTVARVPELPWTLAPGEGGRFKVALDARGRRGTVSKSVFLNTSIGVKRLSVRAVLGKGAEDEEDMADRQRNMAIAMADRSAVFRGECASCHAEPAAGRRGPALYLAVCAICHDSPNRASMVPDLRRMAHPGDPAHWTEWIARGREGSLMPGFAEEEGGPLSAEQIASLAEYLARTLGGRPMGDGDRDDGDARDGRGRRDEAGRGP
ncbi:MAG: DUF1573 domain-containing protein [Verrucomicrobiae bacterium]|nr:DUF1573 domain-containing protein [Verrucomicrobiae bacterium]